MVPMPMSMCVCVGVWVWVCGSTYDYTCAHCVGFHVCVCHGTPPPHTLVSFACHNV